MSSTTISSTSHTSHSTPIDHSIMDTSRTINTLSEAQKVLTRYFQFEISTDLIVRIPEKLLYAPPVKQALKKAKAQKRIFSYDRETSILKIRGMARPVHDAIVTFASEFLSDAIVTGFIPPELRKRVVVSTCGQIMTRMRDIGSGSKLQGWTKYPDISIAFRDEQLVPMIVFETGFAEQYEDLRNDAYQWLLRSGGKVRLVVLVDINEDKRVLQSCQESQDARQRLRKLVRDYGNDFVKNKHGIKSYDDTDTSDAELYDNIRAHIIPSDWMGPITARLELWEIQGSTPALRETAVS
ncbi:hypothetical protein DTO166G4_4118 [Paecilomyces variotii]|nr:hypothetical protein DTO166G4_4118 [Paecilomyces variotii]KAJ9228944.1 hypothetical protein DTO169E5_9033 [Paecilomyces variotii]KAJ9231136.1 hypothetical protein DTO166G5_6908 [Paecilomyces variotii]KAJ9263299.1 hypothetical protein DTO195F2_2955 [Paecilomyces variotii]KAJ9283372.1 hypothetical protein DTO021C3_9064 [Paecilomyces variotii]